MCGGSGEHQGGGAVLVVGGGDGRGVRARSPVGVGGCGAAVAQGRSVAEVPVEPCDVAVGVGGGGGVELGGLPGGPGLGGEGGGGALVGLDGERLEPGGRAARGQWLVGDLVQAAVGGDSEGEELAGGGVARRDEQTPSVRGGVDADRGDP